MIRYAWKNPRGTIVGDLFRVKCEVAYPPIAWHHHWDTEKELKSWLRDQGWKLIRLNIKTWKENK